MLFTFVWHGKKNRYHTCFSYYFKICKVVCFEKSLVFFRLGVNNETAVPAEFSDLPLRKCFLQRELGSRVKVLLTR